jgi:hypothetical protein
MKRLRQRDTIHQHGRDNPGTSRNRMVGLRNCLIGPLLGSTYAERDVPLLWGLGISFVAERQIAAGISDSIKRASSPIRPTLTARMANSYSSRSIMNTIVPHHSQSEFARLQMLWNETMDLHVKPVRHDQTFVLCLSWDPVATDMPSGLEVCSPEAEENVLEEYLTTYRWSG